MVRKALSAVARVDRRYGLTAAVKLLAGIPDPRLLRAGLDRTPTFGVLRGHAEPWLTQLLRRCVTAGWVDLTTGDRPLAVLTAAGRAVMRGERPARLVLPEPASAGGTATSSRSGSRQPAAADSPLSGGEAAVFEALRRARQELARGQQVPAFVVASDRTLRELAVLKPKTLQELQLAHGVGPAKAERYGRQLLQAVAEGLDRV